MLPGRGERGAREVVELERRGSRWSSRGYDDGAYPVASNMRDVVNGSFGLYEAENVIAASGAAKSDIQLAMGENVVSKVEVDPLKNASLALVDGYSVAYAEG